MLAVTLALAHACQHRMLTHLACMAPGLSLLPCKGSRTSIASWPRRKVYRICIHSSRNGDLHGQRDRLLTQTHGLVNLHTFHTEKTKVCMA
jgi:hypothetical protein